MRARSSVWLVAQRPSREQRRRRYLPESNSHPGKMIPALARQVITTYTGPVDVVADPMCGIGTTLVEAAHLGRDGFGIEYEARWAALAQANLALARSAGATGETQVVVGDCRHMRSLLPPELVGQVALVLTSPALRPLDPWPDDVRRPGCTQTRLPLLETCRRGRRRETPWWKRTLAACHRCHGAADEPVRSAPKPRPLDIEGGGMAPLRREDQEGPQ